MITPTQLDISVLNMLLIGGRWGGERSDNRLKVRKTAFTSKLRTISRLHFFLTAVSDWLK